MFGVEDIVKLSSSEESEEDVCRSVLLLGGAGSEGQEFTSGTMGDEGRRFFWRLLARGARIKVWI
jgi:hypothetical protein